MKQNYPVPAFLSKLWTLADDHCTNDLICWSKDGCSVLVHDEEHFCKKVLPLYYKHSNMTSFVRQLNMYGFHKVVHVDTGLLKGDSHRDCAEFKHKHFQKDQPHLLSLIRRKVSISRGIEDGDQISKVLVEISNMRGWQDSFDFKLMALCRENESLWRELSSLQQKYHQHHRLICKIMQLIIHTVQSKEIKGLKRKLPMIDSSELTPTAPKYSRLIDSTLNSNLSSLSKHESPSLQEMHFGSSQQLESLTADVSSNGMIISDMTHLLEPLTEQERGSEGDFGCLSASQSPASSALSSVGLTLSLLEDNVSLETEDKLPERNEESDPLALINSSLAEFEGSSPLSPCLDDLVQLFRPGCCNFADSDSVNTTHKRKKEAKRDSETQTQKNKVAKLRSQHQQEEVEMGGERDIVADLLPSLLQLAQEASNPSASSMSLHTDSPVMI